MHLSLGCIESFLKFVFAERQLNVLKQLGVSVLKISNSQIVKLNGVKWVHIRSFSGLYFLAFGLNTERYSLFLRIQSGSGIMRTRKTPNMDTFYAMLSSQEKNCDGGKSLQSSMLFRKSLILSRKLHSIVDFEIEIFLRDVFWLLPANFSTTP